MSKEKLKKVFPVAKTNTIRIEWAPFQMAYIFLHGKSVYVGNHWDFHPGCHGGVNEILAELYGNYNTPYEFAWRLESFLTDQGGKVKIVQKKINKNHYGIN